MSEARFTLAYDGPALDNHEMDVADLAHSLLALSEAMKAAQKAVDPLAPPVTLHLKATEPGSFEAALILLQPGVIEGLLNLVTGRTATAAVNASALLAMVVAAVKAIKKLAGRAMKSASAKKDKPGTVVVETVDGDTFEIDATTLDLLRSMAFRQAISDVLDPLDREGVQAVRIQAERGTAAPVEVEVTAVERVVFLPPQLPEAEDLGAVERPVTLQPIGVEFDWHKWRFSEGVGSTAFHAAVADEVFRGRVERQDLVIGPQDLLRVTLVTKQFRDRSGALKASNVITKVHDVIDGGRQLPLDFDADPTTAED
ncbi:MAG: hypothetical protein FWF28_10435 [Micrococcales bacterium]|nr:hypothetical protein [Micrococcales bacterium]